MTALQLNGSSSGFDLRRVIGTTRGIVPEVDAYITAELKTLDDLLLRKIFDNSWLDTQKGDGGVAYRSKSKGGSAKKLANFLALNLAPRKAREKSWMKDSLLSRLATDDAKESKKSLSQVLESFQEFAQLKYALQGNISTKLYALDFNDRTVLSGDYPAIADYMAAYAFYVRGLEDVDAVRSFLLNDPDGVKRVVEYAIVSGARAYLDDKKLYVHRIEDDNSPVIGSIRNADISIETGSFSLGVDAVVRTPIFSSAESKLLQDAIDALKIAIPEEKKSLLIQYIKASNAKHIQITKNNIQYFLPAWMQQISASPQVDDAAPTTPDQSDAAFNVITLDDDRSQIQVSRSAVKCAAQLYYGMVLGDELQVFDAMNYFTHKYLVRGSLTIEDSQLRDDLQSYVFSNRFLDSRTKRIVDRTRAPERAMFYKQVFDYGAAQLKNEVTPRNGEFPKLWKVLMLESAKFLERAQLSPNPDNYVSRQNVLQSIEDIQYNLSTNCTGMANVIAPLIYAELDFVIRRIFMHNEVMKKVVPSGYTWWRVVETLLFEMTGKRPKSTVIYNKAKGGNEIIKKIADYDPSKFAQDSVFADLIGNVERFITTQSILQDALTDDLIKAGANGEPAGHADDTTDVSAESPVAKAPVLAQPGSAGDQEWNF